MPVRRPRTPVTQAGRNLRVLIVKKGDPVDDRIITDRILAIEAEAAAQAEDSLDVDILGKAIRVVMDNVQEIGLFPEHSPEIAAEYQRLAAEKPHD